MNILENLTNYVLCKLKDTFTTDSDGNDVIRTSGKVSLLTDTGVDVDIQNPVPADGDSVYVKDIDISECNNYNFSGSVTDYFDSLLTANSDSTSNNPKQIKIWFHRTIYASAIGLGCNDLAGDFSNIKLELLGSGGTVRSTIDLSSDSTKLSSKLIQFTPSAFNGVIISFYTADTTCLSNITIRKEVKVDAQLEALNDDGVAVHIKATDSGNLKVANVEDGLSIAQGKVSGTSSVRKFGDNPDIDTSSTPEDIWEYGGTYNFSTTADIDSVSSSNAGDNQVMRVYGLDTNWNEVVQDVTLNGQTRVALTTPLIRSYRAYNTSGTDLAGIFYVYVNTAISSGVPTDGTKVRAVVDSHHNQTLMAIYTIPAGKTAYFMSAYVSLSSSKTSGATMTFRARLFGGVFRIVNKIGIQSTGSSHFIREPAIPGTFPEKTDILIRCEDVTANGTSISAGFDLVLVDN